MPVGEEVFIGLNQNGLIVFIILIIVCLPLCWIPFLIDFTQRESEIAGRICEPIPLIEGLRQWSDYIHMRGNVSLWFEHFSFCLDLFFALLGGCLDRGLRCMECFLAGSAEISSIHI